MFISRDLTTLFGFKMGSKNIIERKSTSSSTLPSTSISEAYSITIPWEIDEATSGITKGFKNRILRLRNQNNAVIIAKFILSMKNEINLSDNYRSSLLRTLSDLSNYYDNKSFSEITRHDFLSFLNSFRKPEPLDPLHKWVGTYNNYIMIISKFFKWLYFPDLPSKERQKLKPKVIENIARLPRKETSIYKPTYLWTQEDDQLFLRYCPSRREREMLSYDFKGYRMQATRDTGTKDQGCCL